MKSNSRGGNSQTLKAVLGIRDLILGGQFEPGERLLEVMLSEKLGLSRTPLRTALQRLEQEGLVELIPTGGYAVRGFRYAELADAIILRGVLEGTAARLAAERGVNPIAMRKIEETLNELDLVLGNTPDELEFERYVELNAQFHLQLAQLPASDVIAREIARVTALPFASPSAFLEQQEAQTAFRQSLVIGQMHHRSIVEAIAARQGARAESLAREHALLAHHNLETVMKAAPGAIKMPALALVV
jgi:GntR family transcriptional regulator, vanillate catabolism transcriptional regulator